MSTPKSKRREGDLKVLVKSFDLASYTLEVCSNENTFPKKYRWTLTNRILTTAIEINDLLHAANGVKVETAKDYEIRRGMMMKAYALTDALLTDIRLAHVRVGIEYKRLEYWSRLIFDVKTLTRQWIVSDHKRYSKG